jgi:hypothetical protein
VQEIELTQPLREDAGPAILPDAANVQHSPGSIPVALGDEADGGPMNGPTPPRVNSTRIPDNIEI